MPSCAPIVLQSTCQVTLRTIWFCKIKDRICKMPLHFYLKSFGIYLQNLKKCIEKFVLRPWIKLLDKPRRWFKSERLVHPSEADANSVGKPTSQQSLFRIRLVGGGGQFSYPPIVLRPVSLYSDLEIIFYFFVTFYVDGLLTILFLHHYN